MTGGDPQKFIPLKTQWFRIMLSLAGEQHGYGTMQEVLNRTTGKVRLWPATLYGSRRYYRLAALGRPVLDAECERPQELVRTIRVKQAMVTK
jgi:hypothetical protein